MKTRRYVLFLVVALLAFLIGVTVATIFGGITSGRVKTRCGARQALIEPLPVPPLEMVAAPSCRLRREALAPLNADLKARRMDQTNIKVKPAAPPVVNGVKVTVPAEPEPPRPLR